MILDDIMKYRAQQLEREKAACGLDAMKVRAEKALADRKPVSLKAALKKDTISCICEVKKASPSKGLICADFHPVEIAKTYEAAGANIISTNSHGRALFPRLVGIPGGNPESSFPADSAERLYF